MSAPNPAIDSLANDANGTAGAKGTADHAAESEARDPSTLSQLAPILTSFGLHALLILVLALVLLPTQLDKEIFSLIALNSDSDAEPSVDVVVQPDKLIDDDFDDAESSIDTFDLAEQPTPVLLDLDDREVASAMTELEADAVIGTLRGDFGGRSEKGKLAALRKFGGTANSEKAVNRGLKWFASIQKKDGSWDFSDVGKSGDAGLLRGGEMGATAMALLCFLGAGHTHASETQYSDNVANGLRYLIRNAKVISREADLRGEALGNPGMYIQGLATIALSEAQALTRRRKEDKALRDMAQAAVRFIESAETKTGGWRYRPRDDADTSVVGWQVMALKSAQSARLRLDREAFYGTRRFLNSVQTDDGAMYGYTQAQKNRPGTTAIGLLCRMYLGWKRDRPALAAGVKFLSETGPKPDDSYYNYYAAQVLHHWGGAEWKKWNAVMRPQLVTSQIKRGPAAGSWKPVDRHSRLGGRIYETALSVMTLEVYYRHLPLYRRSAVAQKPETE